MASNLRRRQQGGAAQVNATVCCVRQTKMIYRPLLHHPLLHLLLCDRVHVAAAAAERVASRWQTNCARWYVHQSCVNEHALLVSYRFVLEVAKELLLCGVSGVCVSKSVGVRGCDGSERRRSHFHSPLLHPDYLLHLLLVRILMLMLALK